MKVLLLVLLAVVMSGALQAMPLETEAQALAVLPSSATAAEKEAACLRLKQIGTAKSVPALRALLADENFAQWAVDALQTMPAREAGEALCHALPEVSGKTKALVIFALGVRREASVVPVLVKLLSDGDPLVAMSAAQALAASAGARRLRGCGAPGLSRPVRCGRR